MNNTVAPLVCPSVLLSINLKLNYMDLKKPLELMIAHYSSEDYNLKELGIDTEEKIEYLEKTFYSIDAIGKFYEDDDSGTIRGMIYAGGFDFICKISYDQLKQKISINL